MIELYFESENYRINFALKLKTSKNLLVGFYEYQWGEADNDKTLIFILSGHPKPFGIRADYYKNEYEHNLKILEDFFGNVAA